MSSLQDLALARRSTTTKTDLPHQNTEATAKCLFKRFSAWYHADGHPVCVTLNKGQVSIRLWEEQGHKNVTDPPPPPRLYKGGVLPLPEP